MLGAMLSLTSGICFGLNIAAIRRGVLRADVREAMTITVLVGVPAFALAGLLLGGLPALRAMPLESLCWMASAGVVHFVVGRYSDYRATQALGAALSTPVQQCSVAVSLLLAVVLFGETLTAQKLVGLGLMLAGPLALVSRRRSGAAAVAGKVFHPAYGPGLFWGTACALCYGSSPLLISMGLAAGRNTATAVAGGFVSNSAAALVVAGMVLASGGLRWLRGFDREARRWFFLSGGLVAISQILLYSALALAPVAVVVPLQRLSVMFRVIFSGLFNRDAEIFDRRVIVGLIVSLLGALAISTDTALLREILAPAGPAAG